MQQICIAVRNLDRILVDEEYGESFLWLIGIDTDLARPVVHFQVMIARYHFETLFNTEVLMLMKTRLLCEWLPHWYRLLHEWISLSSLGTVMRCHAASWTFILERQMLR